jgi:hypothetical protein
MKHLLKITLDFSFLISNGLSPDEYIYLYIQYHKLYRVGAELPHEVNLESLEERGWVEIIYDEEGTLVESILRHKAISLFEENNVDSKFFEFFSTYPLKVPNENGIGYRPLRAREVTSKQAIELKKVYTHLIKNKVGLHDEIMRGLKAYMEAHKQKLPFMHGIEKFLSEHIWEMYTDSDLQTTENKFSVDV